MSTDSQVVPVRLYQTDGRMMLVAPMPGLEPADISVTIDGHRVVLRGNERGPHQHERELLIAEWAVGSYYREVDLPEPADAALSNVTYDNGILVVSMPKAAAPGRSTELRLESVSATRGERVGHVGRAITPASTSDHQRGKHERARQPAHAETEPRAESGYAHVNIWRLGPGDDGSDRSVASAIAERLRQARGFRSYTVVRTGEHEVVAVTVFDSESQLRAALGTVGELVRGRLHPLAAERPERREGPVVHHAAAA